MSLDTYEPFPKKSGSIIITMGIIAGCLVFYLTSMLSFDSYISYGIPEPSLLWLLVALVVLICNPAFGAASIILIGLSKTRWGSDLEQAKRYMDQATWKDEDRRLASVSQRAIEISYKTGFCVVVASVIMLNIGFYIRLGWIAFPNLVIFLLGCSLVIVFEDEYYINWASGYLDERFGT